MAENAVKCGVPKCGRMVEVGKGGRVGDVSDPQGPKGPRCAMHLARERRGSTNANVAGKLTSEAAKTSRITVWLTPEAERKATAIASSTDESVSGWASGIIEAAIAKTEKKAAARAGVSA